MKVKIKPHSNFYGAVFGADDIVRHFPELETTGAEVLQKGTNYYLMIDGKIAHDSCFFSAQEMQHLEEVK